MMTTESTVHIAHWLLLLGAAAVGAGAISVIQWMARTASLYSLHTSRERLYEIAFRHPEVRATSLYRSIESIVSGVIAVVRDSDHSEGSQLHSDFEMAIRRARSSPATPEREESARRVREEFCSAADDEGLAMLEELRATMRQTRAALKVWALGGNFITFLLAVFFMVPVMLITSLMGGLQPARDDVLEAKAVEAAVFRFRGTRPRDPEVANEALA